VTSTGEGNYVVKPGDTLFSIARKNHILLGKLMKLNNIGLGTPLHAGQELRIHGQQSYVADAVPTTKPAAPQKLPVGAMPSYTVKKGDTLWGIARDHHLTLAQIRKLNKMKKIDRIHTGMVLAVGKPIQAPRKTYTVKKGDTLWLIAKKHGMTTQELRKLNGLQRKDTIHTGMVLALKKGVKLPAKVQPSREKQIVARLKKKGAKKEDITAVMARIRKSKKKNPDIEAILAQVQKKKRKPKPVQTPLRVAKKKSKTRKGSRYNSAMALLTNHRSSSRVSRSNNRVIRVAKRYLGRRYVWGAVGPSTFDCSGFTQYVMRKAKGVRLPRVSRKQAYYGKYVSRSHLRPGDLIFFDTSRRRRGYVNHVGIYIGNNKFIHASSGKHRVVITSLNRPFYRSRFKWGRRVN
jgi:cell wall-associated NlpC family hydrolase